MIEGIVIAGIGATLAALNKNSQNNAEQQKLERIEDLKIELTARIRSGSVNPMF